LASLEAPPLFLWPCFCFYFSPQTSTNENKHVIIVFGDWCISLTMMISSSIHYPAYDTIHVPFL
jgi:hypothetical protein